VKGHASDGRSFLSSLSRPTASVLAGAGVGLLLLGRRGRHLRATFRRDIEVIRQRDPAARNIIEIATCYSGLHALLLHRVAHHFWVRKVPVVPRIVSQISRGLTQIEIHPGATIDEGFFVDHGAGVVIGETTEIGRDVTVYQGVTLGGTGKQTGKRHPTIGDNVIIGAGAKVMGSITVGHDAKIGAGSIVVQDVPPNSTVVGNPGRPVITDGSKVGIPDIDYRHLPDPVSQAMQCLVVRMVSLENEMKEVAEHNRSLERRLKESLRPSEAQMGDSVPSLYREGDEP